MSPLLSLWVGRGATGTLATCWSLVALVVTYSLHAMVGVALGGLFVGLRGRRGLIALGGASRCDLVWKLALWLPLVTTAGTVALGAPMRDRGATGGFDQALLSEGVRPSEGVGSSLIAPLALVAPRTLLGDRAVEIVAAALALGLALGFARFAGEAYRLSRRLRHRRPAQAPRIAQSLARVGGAMRMSAVRVTESLHIDSPMVLGTSEICLPADGLSTLSEPELDAVLAHEVAHLERRDGLWIPLLALLRACLWFHPVTRWLSARVADSTELACDDRAALLIADPANLARALAHVAARVSQRASTRLVAAMATTTATAGARSRLFVRVQRLVQSGSPPVRPLSQHRELAVWLGAMLLGLACLRVSVRFSGASARSVGDHDAHAAGSPSALEAAMADLIVDEQRVSAKLREVLTALAPLGSAAEDKPAVLELRQELSHLRAMQAWTEAQLVAAAPALSVSHD